MKHAKLSWWKILTIFLLLYTFLMGYLYQVPQLPILNESIRNLYFHVPMWFVMLILLLVSVVASALYLHKGQTYYDLLAMASAKTGLVFGVLGLVTGMVWARFTWGAYWSGDPKQNASAIGLLMYMAYFLLRNSLEDEQQRARIGAVYNIFAYPVLIALLMILPRMTDSLHPGSGGNPGFNTYDTDNNMLMVFYPAVIGWILLGVWVTQLETRIARLQQNIQG